LAKYVIPDIGFVTADLATLRLQLRVGVTGK